MVTEDTCAACDFSSDPANRCQRKMDWRWRGEYYPATREETEGVRLQLMNESFDGVPYSELPPPTQDTLLKARLKIYSAKAHKRVKDTIETDRMATVCQRENAFYVNTVRDFRDRRYEYKGLTKKWSKILSAAEKAGNLLDAEVARGRHVYYESLQLAHKCILNSFYGYVMRKGARWHSMEMAGVVTYTGSKLIQQARTLVEQVGRPLEIDTDGIWCILPASFPQDFAFTTTSGGRIPISYPCVMLNADVHDNYTNHQYQQLMDPATRSYAIRSECSIFFELDGPHRAMILPASPEEGKLLKKRYAVFAPDGTLSELKGFELKRRGELKMVKVFQSQVFDRFLDGTSLQECYAAVGEVADYWLNILDTQGEDLDDAELIEFLSENRSLSRTVEDYGEQKSVALSTAKRLAEFLGADMVKDKGLACKLLVAIKPAGAPVTERAIPTTIFEAEPEIMRHYLRKWCKDSSMTDFNIRSILDWDYYRTRLAATIQKIISIPAALQGIANPVPRVIHPEWLTRLVATKASAHKQLSLSRFFAAGGKGGATSTSASGGASGDSADIEDGIGGIKIVPSHTGTSSGAVTMSSKARAFFRKSNDLLSTATSGPLADVAAGAGAGAGSGGKDDAMVVVDVEESLVEPGPPLAEGASKEERDEWLASRKDHWRQLSLARKRKRAADASSSALTAAPKGSSRKGGSGGGGAVSSESTTLVSANAFSLATTFKMPTKGYWQVVEVRENPEGDPGTYRVLAFTSPKKLQVFEMSVERILYINRYLPLEPGPLLQLSELTSRRLPHDAPPYFCYKIALPERRFQRHVKTLTRAIEGSDPLVAGVYETQTPLLLRAILRLGCVVQAHVRPSAQQLWVPHKPNGGKGGNIASALAGARVASHQSKLSLANKGAGASTTCTAAHTASAAAYGSGGSSIDTHAFDALLDAAQSQQVPQHEATVATTCDGGKAARGEDLPEDTGAVRPAVASRTDLMKRSRTGGASLLAGANKASAAARATMDGFLAGGGRQSASHTAHAHELGSSSLGSHDVASTVISSTAKQYGLEDLEFLTVSTHPYLSPVSSTYRLAYLYHSAPSFEDSGNPTARSLTVLCLSNETNTALVSDYIIALINSLKEEMRPSSMPPATTLEGALEGLDPSEITQLVQVMEDAVMGQDYPLPVTIYAFVVGAPTDAGAANKGFPPFRKLYESSNSGAAGHVGNVATFKPAHVRDQAEAWKRVATVLSNHGPSASARNSPIMLLTATRLSKAALIRLMPVLNTIPIFPCPYAVKAESQFSAMNWSTAVAARSFINYFRLVPWWQQRVRAARYVQVPIGNLMLSEEETPRYRAALAQVETSQAGMSIADSHLATRMADIFYARMLQFNKHTLWVSESAIPDLGGVETDAVSGAGAASSTLALYAGLAASERTVKIDWDGGTTSAGSTKTTTSHSSEALIQLASGMVLPSANPVTNTPGMYRCMTVDVSIEYLAVNTVLNSSHFSDVEGGAGDALASFEAQYDTEMQQAMDEMAAIYGPKGEGEGGAASADAFMTAALRAGGTSAAASTLDSGSCVVAFRALKRLVGNWYHDVKTGRSPFATQLLERFYTWLASPSSLLHDPALHRLVHALMRKMYDLLLRQLRVAGVTVVHATFTKLTVATGKQTPAAALLHLRHVLGKIVSQPLFAVLQLTHAPMHTWWHQILFVDNYNYAGIRHQQVEEGAGGERDLNDTHEHDDAGGDAVTHSMAPTPSPPLSDLSEVWGEKLVAEAVANLREGRDAGDLDWKALEREYLAEATECLHLENHWTFGDYLHPSAQAMLGVVLGNYVSKPLRAASRRAFARLKDKFTTHVLPALGSEAGAATALTLDLHINHDVAGGGGGVGAGHGSMVGVDSVGYSNADSMGLGEGSEVFMTPHDDSESLRGDDSGHATSHNNLSHGRVSGGGHSDPTPSSTAAKLTLPAIRSLMRSLSKEEEASEKGADGDFIRNFTASFLRDKLVECVRSLESEASSGEGEAELDPRTGQALEFDSDMSQSDMLRRARYHASLVANPTHPVLLASKKRPALPLVTCVCAILALDDRVLEDVTRLRSTLLALLSVGEFSAIAKFSDASCTIVLPDVVCKMCSYVRDVDIARDEHMRVDHDEHVNPSTGVPSAKYRFHWFCPSCNTNYDSADMEADLVALVEWRSMAYQTQDVFCMKCRRARSSPLRTYCECSGRYTNAESRGNFAATLHIFKGLAAAYKFYWLADTVDALLTADSRTS